MVVRSKPRDPRVCKHSVDADDSSFVGTAPGRKSRAPKYKSADTVLKSLGINSKEDLKELKSLTREFKKLAKKYEFTQALLDKQRAASTKAEKENRDKFSKLVKDLKKNGSVDRKDTKFMIDTMNKESGKAFKTSIEDVVDCLDKLHTQGKITNKELNKISKRLYQQILVKVMSGGVYAGASGGIVATKQRGSKVNINSNPSSNAPLAPVADEPQGPQYGPPKPTYSKSNRGPLDPWNFKSQGPKYGPAKPTLNQKINDRGEIQDEHDNREVPELPSWDKYLEMGVKDRLGVFKSKAVQGSDWFKNKYGAKFSSAGKMMGGIGKKLGMGETAEERTFTKQALKVVNKTALSVAMLQSQEGDTKELIKNDKQLSKALLNLQSMSSIKDKLLVGAKVSNSEMLKYLKASNKLLEASKASDIEVSTSLGQLVDHAKEVSKSTAVGEHEKRGMFEEIAKLYDRIGPNTPELKALKKFLVQDHYLSEDQLEQARKLLDVLKETAYSDQKIVATLDKMGKETNHMSATVGDLTTILAKRESVMQKKKERSGVRGLFGGLSSLMPEPLKKGFSLLFAPFKFLGGLFKTLFVGSLGAMFTMFKGGAKWLLPGFAKLFGMFTALVGVIDFYRGFTNASEITGKLENTTPEKIVAGISKAIDGITFGLINAKDAYEFIQSGISGTADVVEGFSKDVEKFDWAKLLGDIKTGYFDFVGEIREFASNVKKALMPGGMFGGIRVIFSAFGDVLTWLVKTKLPEIGKEVKKSYQEIKASFGEGGGMSSILRDLFGEGGLFTWLGTVLASFGQTALDVIGDAAKAGLGFLVNLFKKDGLLDSLWSLGKDLFSLDIKGVQESWMKWCNAVEKTIKDLFSSEFMNRYLWSLTSILPPVAKQVARISMNLYDPDAKKEGKKGGEKNYNMPPEWVETKSKNYEKLINDATGVETVPKWMVSGKSGDPNDFTPVERSTTPSPFLNDDLQFLKDAATTPVKLTGWPGGTSTVLEEILEDSGYKKSGNIDDLLKHLKKIRKENGGKLIADSKTRKTTPPLGAAPEALGAAPVAGGTVTGSGYRASALEWYGPAAGAAGPAGAGPAGPRAGAAKIKPVSASPLELLNTSLTSAAAEMSTVQAQGGDMQASIDKLIGAVQNSITGMLQGASAIAAAVGDASKTGNAILAVSGGGSG